MKTMAQYALSTQDAMLQAVVKDLLNYGAVLVRDIPFVDKKTLVTSGLRFTENLPDVNWASVNDEDIPDNHSEPKPFTEQAYLIRDYVKTDEVLDEDESSVNDTHAFDIEIYLEALALDFNDKFFNNHHRKGGNEKSIVGLKERIDYGTKYGVDERCKIDAGALNLTDTATAADLGKFSEILNTLLLRVNSPTGQGVVIYLAYELMFRLERIAAQFAGQGGFSQSTDQFGRTITMYKGARFEPVGLKKDQATNIISIAEAADGLSTGSGLTHTSMYAVKYGGNGLSGWQYRPVRTRQKPDDIYKKTLIDWVGGIGTRSTRSIARVFGLKLA